MGTTFWPESLTFLTCMWRLNEKVVCPRFPFSVSLAGLFLHEQFMMVRTFTKHFGATFRTRFFLARDTLLMRYPFSAFRADTESSLTHIVPALLYHWLLLVLRKNM